MDGRREQRFEIYGPVKLTSLSTPGHELDCVLLDVSATGLKVIASESLPVDEIVAVESDENLALADVRYSQPRGDKFTIGCERIHLLQKVALPKDRDKIDHVRLLITDYRDRMREGMSAERPGVNAADAARLNRRLLGEESAAAPESPPAGRPLPAQSGCTTREELLEAAADWVVEQWHKLPSDGQQHPTRRSEIVDRLTFHLAERLRAQTVPSAAPASPPASPPAEDHQIPEKPAIIVRRGRASDELPPLSKPRRWRLPVGLAATAILGWAITSLFWSYGTSGGTPHLPSSMTSLIPSRTDASAPANHSAGMRNALITAVEPTWVDATSDGKHLFSKKLLKDDSRKIEFSESAVLRIGNAKGVEISVDGKSIGPIGRSGQMRVIEINANGYRFLPVK